MTPVEFVKTISQLHLPNVFNPYSEICSRFDKIDAPKIRRNNLLHLLEASISERVQTMWVARDLGYLGGRRTGVALTDDMRLSTYASHFRSLTLHRATNGPPVGEKTAGITWEMLDRIGQPVFLWNAFPLHPHEPERPFTNRCHTRSERQTCKPLLIALIEMLRPKTIVTIGNDAEAALLDMGLHTHRVRHPSYGGKADFVAGLSQIYGLRKDDGPQHSLAL